MAYEFGPIGKVKITLSGEAGANYGSFTDLPSNVQEFFQLVCHAVCQVRDLLEQADDKPYYMEDIWVIKIGNQYLFNDDEMMTIMNVERIGTDYDIEFFSGKRLVKIQPLIDLAYDHFDQYGRVQ